MLIPTARTIYISTVRAACQPRPEDWRLKPARNDCFRQAVEAAATVPLRVVRVSPTGEVADNAPLGKLTVTFNAPMVDNSVTGSDAAREQPALVLTAEDSTRESLRHPL